MRNPQNPGSLRTPDVQKYPAKVPLAQRPVGVLQSWQLMRENVLNIIPEAATQEKTISGVTVNRWHMVMDPPLIQEILLEKLDNYPKSTVTKNVLRPAIGESLFIAEGAHWRWQRRATAPVFSHRNVSALTPIMSAAADRCANRIAAAGKRAVNMLEEMISTTFDVIAEVTFSADGSFDRNAVLRAIDMYISDAGRVSLLDVLGAPDWVPRPGRMRASAEMAAMRENADAAIQARAERGPGQVPDLLDLLHYAEDPKSGRKMTTSEIRDNLLTFIVAGHETTALTLAWSLYLCAFDPAVQAIAHAQARAVLGDRMATADDLDALPNIRQIVEEALRLYPPAAILSRIARKSDTLGGARIQAEDTVMVPIYAVGRHRALWQDPDAFDPGRFANRKEIPRYSYLPFGDGPRICIGASFAMQEAVIVLATLLARFRFKPVQGRTPEPVMILTLRPEGGVWLTAEPA